MNKTTVTVIASVLAIIILIGFFLPLDSYTTSHGCPLQETPTERLNLILGDSIEKVKKSDITPGITEGCAANTKYTLYLF